MDGPRRHQFRSRRVDLEMSVELTFNNSARVVDARSVNISETGMLVRTEVDHPPGTGVRFDVVRRFGGRGEVVWSRETEEGAVLMGLALSRSRYALVELLEEFSH